MASIASEISQDSKNRIESVKALAESPELTSIPASYTFNNLKDEMVSEPDDDDPIPTIDYFSLISDIPNQRSKAVHDLAKACEEWGFFILVNHSLSKGPREKMIDEFFAFFSMTEEEKQVYAGKEQLDPIRYGTSFNASMDTTFFWRDYLKILVHPEFHSPDKPALFRETSAEFCKRSRKVGRELLKGISESLGLEANYIEKAMNLDLGLQLNVANFYPPCPQPELALGMPPHSDHGLLNLLIQNGVGGLQVLHNGKWVNVHANPNNLLVFVADHLEIMSNGKYKSVLHRAVVSNKATRMSIATVIGPAMDTFVEPAPVLLDRETNPAAYTGMKAIDFLKLQRGNNSYGKFVIDHVKI